MQLNDKDEWFEVTAEKAREKTSQALREKAPELRKIGDGIGSCRIIDKTKAVDPKVQLHRRLGGHPKFQRPLGIGFRNLVFIRKEGMPQRQITLDLLRLSRASQSENHQQCE